MSEPEVAVADRPELSIVMPVFKEGEAVDIADAPSVIRCAAGGV